jgi:hypothetical protein
MRESYKSWPEDLKRRAEGRGTGEGANYTPWIGVGEFSSLGEEKLLPGKLIRRLHTTHSQIERAFLEVIETKAHVADIREQYPLDIAATYQIAKDLVIIHPRDYKTKADLVMTTDFLIVGKAGSLEACAIKNSRELRLTRTLQKLEIEQEYWRRKGILWHLYTEREAGDANTRNCRWLAEALLFHGVAFPKEIKEAIKAAAEQKWLKAKTATEVAAEIDKALGLSNQSLHVIKEFIRERKWDWNSYHGLLECDTFRLERHWTGELVLRSQIPLEGFSHPHSESDLYNIQLAWGKRSNEKLKKHRRKLAATERETRPPGIKREIKIRVRNPKPPPFKAQVGLPRPLHDELLWSVICRYYEKMGKPPINPFSIEVWGVRTQPGVLVTQYLEDIASHFPPSLGITESSLRTKNTTWQFECNWSPASKEKPSATTHLKSCPACRKSDMERVGVAYWHRIHQLDGVTHCLKHKARLEISKRPAITQKAARNWTPDFFTPANTEWQELPKGDLEVEKFFLVQAQRVLRGQTLPWEVQKQSLWGEMERQGYIRGVMVDGWKVLADAEAKYKDQLKSLFHLENNAWGRRTITNILTGVEPDPHRLMFLHCFLGLPVNVEKPAAKLEPIDGTPRPSRPRVDKPAKERRKLYLVKIKGLKEIEDLPETQAMKLTDPEWMDKLIMSRRKKVEEMKRLRQDLDESLANLIEETTASLKVGEAGLEPVTLERIMREANDRRILLCLKEPMVSKALEGCIDTKDAVIQRRIYWGRENLDTQSYYEFIDKSHLRGIELPEWAMAEIRSFVGVSREENIRRRLEQDEETAKKVRKIAEEFRNRPGRPEWVRKTNLTRELGITVWGPETEKALNEESDTNESILQRRIAWAKENFPKGKQMTRYEVRDYLGLRGWRERPNERELIDQLLVIPPL